MGARKELTPKNVVFSLSGSCDQEPWKENLCPVSEANPSSVCSHPCFSCLTRKTDSRVVGNDVAASYLEMPDARLPTSVHGRSLRPDSRDGFRSGHMINTASSNGCTKAPSIALSEESPGFAVCALKTSATTGGTYSVQRLKTVQLKASLFCFCFGGGRVGEI